MPASINIASVISISSDSVNGLFVVDHYSGKVHRLSASESDPVESGRVMMAVRNQMRESLPHTPDEEIAEVLKTERSVTESSYKQATERGSNE